MASLERNCRDFGIRFAGLDDDRQGIVHVIGPELGLTQPGMTIACGDSHTSTHGAFGAVAFGIGTSQVRDVLASQCLAIEPMKVRRIRVTGTLAKGVYAKDVILDDHPAARRARRHRLRLRVRRRRHRAHVDGRADDDLQHVDRGRRARRLRQPRRDDVRVPEGPAVRAAGRCVRARETVVAVDGVGRGCVVRRRGRDSRRGADAGRDLGRESRTVDRHRRARAVAGRAPTDPQAITDALDYMGLAPAQPIAGMKVDVAFIGSCTNARLSDLREAARIVKGRHVAPHVKALVVPGSASVSKAAEREGLAEIFRAAGFEWRGAGCSMCLGMNPDKLEGQSGVRGLVEPQLQGPAGKSHRPHAADEPGDGRGRGGGRRRSPTCGRWSN